MGRLIEYINSQIQHASLKTKISFKSQKPKASFKAIPGLGFLDFGGGLTVFTRLYVDLSRPKNQSKKLPKTYTWVKTSTS